MVVVRLKLLSVIVPAYKQEKTISKDIGRIERVLNQIRYDYEIVVVVDGRIDKTFENASRRKSAKIKVIGYQHNHGKGYAVRYGIARARGDLVAFIDAGMDIDPNGLSMLLEHLEWYNADIVIGSKRHPVSEVSYPWSRRILSLATQIIAWLLFGLKVRDTQVGLKIFKRKVLEDVFPRLLIKRWAFDTEILAVANRIGYKRIYEAPVKIAHRFSSSVRVFGPNGVWKTLVDALAIFYRLRVLKYYDDKNKRRWRFDPDLNFKINIG